MTEEMEIAEIKTLFRRHFPGLDAAYIAEAARVIVAARRSHSAQIIPFRRPDPCQTSPN